MRDNLELVARPEEVYQGFMGNGLVCRTSPKAADGCTLAPAELANRSAFHEPDPRVYFAGPTAGNIKIGFTRNVDDRWGRLVRASPVPIWMWATVRGEKSLEREYHRRFAAHRLHGEWFERCPEIEAEIARLTAVTQHQSGDRHGR